MKNRQTVQIGETIRNARQSLGMSQEELAGKIHVSKQTISVYERGEAPVPEKNIQNLASALNLPPDSLRAEKKWSVVPAAALSTIGCLFLTPSLLPAAAAAAGVKKAFSYMKNEADRDFTGKDEKTREAFKELLTYYDTLTPDQRKQYLNLVSVFLPQEKQQELPETTKQMLSMTLLGVYSMSGLPKEESAVIADEMESLLTLYFSATEEDRDRMLEAIKVFVKNPGNQPE